MTVHIIVLIFTLVVYGFAPYGFVQFTERSLVQQSNLAVEVVERIIVPNVWGGPPQVRISSFSKHLTKRLLFSSPLWCC